MQPAELCEPCSQILLTNYIRFQAHHRSAQELVACSCSLCKILCVGFRNSSCPIDEVRREEDENFLAFHYQLGLDGSIERGPTTILFNVTYPNRKKVKDATPASRMFFHQKILVIPERPGNVATAPDQVANMDVVKWAKDIFKRKLPVEVGTELVTTPSRNTSSQESWGVASHWLETCLNTHSKCGQTLQPEKVPTRLLDVGMQSSSYVRLHKTDKMSHKLPYTTLSHCWGKIQIKQLTESNFNSMMEGIRIDELPRTFQDAITITRRLGVRYLWIDSLCIMQDSASDWERESSMMGDVYQNGLCNIAATGAPDGRSGCFMERDPSLAQKCRVRVDKKISKFNLKPGLYDLVPRNLWEDGLTNAPLNKRAWVAQERILAQRVLHFGVNQLFWECNEMDACEAYPSGPPHELSYSDSLGYSVGSQEFGFKRIHFKNLDPASVRSEIQIEKTPLTVSLRSPLPSGSMVDPYYVWNKILLAYTRCALTKEHDKLVAISAVAKKIRVMASDDYLAGMWRRFLEYHLLWATDSRDAKRVRMTEYVAPSWSWASMKSTIQPYLHIRPDNPAMIKILDARIQLVSADPTGQVSGGYLKIQGWLRKFHIADPKQIPYEIPLGRGPEISQIAHFDEMQSSEQDVWFLPVISLGPWIAFEAFGLMLQETGMEDEYRRVGRFKAGGDLAPKLFRLPTYPPGQADQTPGSSQAALPEKKGWFGGKKKKMDESSEWRERIFTII